MTASNDETETPLEAREVDLTPLERDDLVTRKATCPFLGSAIATQELPVRNSPVIPLASVQDVVDRAALIAALRSKHLGGFALDPLYEAPGRSDDELLTFPNVAISPHLAAQPRFNALNDLSDLCAGLAQALRA